MILRPVKPGWHRKLRPGPCIKSIFGFSQLYSYGVPGGGGGGAAPTRGNFTQKSGGGTTAGITTVGGTSSVLLVFICCADGDNPTITDNKGNTWTSAVQYNQIGVGSGDRIKCWALYNAAGGAGHTITESGGGGADVITFIEYTGATGFELATSVDDLVGPPWSVTSGTTTVANSKVVTQGTLSGVNNSSTLACTPATVFTQETNYATYWAFGLADQTLSATGTSTQTWSHTPSTSGTLGLIIIKGT